MTPFNLVNVCIETKPLLMFFLENNHRLTLIEASTIKFLRDRVVLDVVTREMRDLPLFLTPSLLKHVCSFLVFIPYFLIFLFFYFPSFFPSFFLFFL